MSPRRLLLSLAIAVLPWVHAAGSVPPRVDRYGDPLPPGAVARLGTVRLRPGESSGVMALSPDSKTLATGEMWVVRLWDLSTGRERRACEAPDGVRVFALAFSADGKRLAAAVDQQGYISRSFGQRHSIYVYDVANDKRLHKFTDEHVGFQSVAFTAGSRFLAAHLGPQRTKAGEESGDVVFWNLVTGKEVRRLPQVKCWGWTEDGKFLAGATKDGIARLWDTATGREVRQFKAPRPKAGTPDRDKTDGISWTYEFGQEGALAFSPDGKTLCWGEAPVTEPEGKKAAVGSSLRLWDVATGKERRTLRGLARPVRKIRFTADGRAVAASDAGGSLGVWSAATGKRLGRFANTIGGKCTWALTPDGKGLFWQQSADTLHLWDIATAKDRRRWEGHGWFGPLLVSSDGKVLVSRNDSLRLWDVAGGAELQPRAAHRSEIASLAWSPRGSRLASLDEHLILRAWDAATGRPVFCSEGGARRVLRFGFAEDGRTLAALGDDYQVRVWDATTGEELRRFTVGPKTTLRLWDDRDDYPLSGSRLSEFAGMFAVFGPGNRMLAVAHEDHAIHLWDTASGKEIRVLKGHRDMVGALHFSPDGRRLVSHARDHTLRLWDVASGREVRSLSGKDDDHTFFAFSGDGRLLAWGIGERILLCAAATGKELRSLAGHPGGTSRVCFSGDGSLLASAGGDRAIRLWDTASGRERRRIVGEEDHHRDGHIYLLTSPDGRPLANASVDGKHSRFALRDLVTGRTIHTPSGQNRFTLPPDGRVLAVSEWDAEGCRVALYELATGTLVGRLAAGHRGDIGVVAFSPDGKRLATGGSDTSILIRDWMSGSGLAPRPGRKSAASRDARWADLAATDGRKAYQAVFALAASGDDAVGLLKGRLPPASAKEATAVRQWIADLDSNDFMAREKASRELLRRGAEAEPLLQEALGAKPSLEMRRRVEALLAAPELTRWSPASLRAIRATQVLETMATPAARRLLEAWARGTPHARLTVEARQSLQRLARRPPTRP